jgi:tetratricopeptide (TPR) repeat protein
VAAGLAAAFLVVAFRRAAPRLPEPGTAAYDEYVEAFRAGLVALDDTERQWDHGQEVFGKAVALIPEEPAGWANLGLAHLRSNELDDAADALARARELAPESGEVAALLGLLDYRQAKDAEAADLCRAALAQRPDDVQTLFVLAHAVRGAGGADADAEYQRLVEDALRLRPNNLVLLRERAGSAVRRQDRAALREVVARWAKQAPQWKGETREALARLAGAADEPPGDAAAALDAVCVALLGEPAYQRDIEEVAPLPRLAGRPLRQFLRLRPMPAAAGLRHTDFAGDADRRVGSANPFPPEGDP